jgi:hypothetical protein
MENDINEVIAQPILNWVYSSNDGDLEGTVGSVKDNSRFPQPVLGNHVFSKTPALSSTY